MSKLIKKLLQVSQSTNQPLGFRLAAVAKSQAMLLIASLSQVNTKLAVETAAAGADAIVLPLNNVKTEAEAFKQITQAVEGIPWGVWLINATRDDIERLKETGCDFIIFSALKASPTVLQEEEIGRVLQIDPGLEEGLARTIDQLPVDTVLIERGKEDEPTFSVHNLMACQRIVNLISKPLLITAPSAVSDDDLQTLCKAGIDGVVVPIEDTQPKERLLALREAIDKLPPTTKRQRRKVHALLPHVAEQVSIDEEEE